MPDVTRSVTRAGRRARYSETITAAVVPIADTHGANVFMNLQVSRSITGYRLSLGTSPTHTHGVDYRNLAGSGDRSKAIHYSARSYCASQHVSFGVSLSV